MDNKCLVCGKEDAKHAIVANWEDTKAAVVAKLCCDCANKTVFNFNIISTEKH